LRRRASPDASTADYWHVVKAQRMLRGPCWSAIDVDRMLTVRVHRHNALLGCLMIQRANRSRLLTGSVGRRCGHERDCLAKARVDRRPAGAGQFGASRGGG
jgi:hypothetical protein